MNVDALGASLADRYSLERELGAGGMATVYLAHDLKHDRKVALKILKPELAAVLGAERFLTEIRTTANLQHPHILPLHDSGAVDGTVFYVMPFVEGESLRDRLAREKQLPIPDAVRIATEVAGALDYAHRHGVIHRDVKPENILLHDGSALVADFGIALAASNTGSSRLTETGMSLGTPHYMSPEQAMGERTLDARTDIYALGCVLYEMLTGDPPFGGSTAQAIVAKVMTEKPVAPSRARDTIPEEVEEAVLTALQKLPADRFASAAEFSAALREGAMVTGPRRRAVAPSAATPAGRLGWPALTAMALAAAAWGWLRPGGPKDNPNPPTRLAVPIPTFGGSATALQRQLALTPDGGTLILTALAPEGGNRTMAMPLTDTAAVAIAGVPEFLADYVISPDGREMIAGANPGRVYRFAVGGGNPRLLPEAVSTAQHAIWRADGSVWFSSRVDREGGIIRVATDGTVSRPFGAEHGDIMVMQELPDHRHALAIRSSMGTASGPVMLFDLESGETTPLLDEEVTQVGYTSGHLVLARPNGSLEAYPFDPGRRKITGAPVQLAAGVSITGTGSAQFAVSTNGTVAYVPEESRTLMLVDRQGTARFATSERRNFHAPMFSPDGRFLSTDFNTPNGRDIWIIDLGGGSMRRGTFVGDGHDATWTPDGRWVTFLSVRSGSDLTLHRARPGQAESAESLFTSPTLGYTGVWLPDGSGLVTAATGLQPESLNDIGIVRNAGAGPLESLVSTRFREQFPAVSPDGGWLAFASTQSGRNEIYVRPLEGGGDQVQVSLAGGVEPVWSRDGRELFYRAGEGVGTDLVAAAMAFSPGPAVTRRTVLFPVTGYATATPHTNYDISPDGRMFAFVAFNQASRVMIIQNLPALVARLQGGGQ